jgi:hypothetical protein
MRTLETPIATAQSELRRDVALVGVAAQAHQKVRPVPFAWWRPGHQTLEAPNWVYAINDLVARTWGLRGNSEG